MTAYSNAKAGRFSIGERDLDKAWDHLAGGIARAGKAEVETPIDYNPDVELGAQSTQSLFGPEASEAEAQLHAYLDRFKETRPRGFPPFEALSARLSEFSAQSQHQAVFGETLGSPSPQPASLKQKPQIPGGMQLAWFEDKFGELKHLLSHRERDKAEIIAINSRLAEIIDRVDRLATTLPGEKAMAAVETQLSVLTKSFEGAREQSAADADRISRAAREIHDAANNMEVSRRVFDTVAKETIKELGQSVSAAASTTSTMIVQQITSAMGNVGPQSRLARLESELRALNVLSKESDERTTAALNRVDTTLREFLDQGDRPRLNSPAADNRKRIGVQTPIASNAPAFLRSTRDFGGMAAKEPKLEALTLRAPNRGQTNMRTEGKKMHADQRPGAEQNAGANRATHSRYPANERRVQAMPETPSSYSSPAAQKPYHLQEEERAFPIAGLSVVAIVLLMASAALLYLYVSGNSALIRSSLLEGPAKLITLQPALYGSVQIDLPSGRTAPLGYASHFGKPPTSDIELPTLFSAAEASDVPPQKKLETPEDVEKLANDASRGDREAQFRIGSRFLSDLTTPGDGAAAVRWLSRAAEQGHVEAQFLLASMFERGVGVDKNQEQAIAWYRKAAGAGYERAMHNLGVLLANLGTDRDYREAAVWFARAGAHGLTDSQFNLAALYERGLGVSRNDRKAYFWYSAAAQRGDKGAKLEAERLEQSIKGNKTGSISQEADSWKPQSLPLGWRKDEKNDRG